MKFVSPDELARIAHFATGSKLSAPQMMQISYAGSDILTGTI
jgi:hypothetical protein